MVANLPLLNAFEAHIINVTASITNDIPTGEFCSAGEPVVELSIISTDADMANAEIWYTVDYDNDPDDGGNPVCDDPGSLLYNDPSYLGTGPFELYSSATVRAVSCHYRGGELLQSAVVSMYYDDVSIANCNPSLKITKVYYDVDSGHYEPCQEWKSEWVEIYNPTSSPVNIKNWEICDNTDCDILSSSDLFIPAGGYAVITGKSTTWKYWDIPAGVVKIVLDSPIGGDGLDNDGDRVILLRSNGNRADAMSYGTDTFIFNPSCPDVAEGNMLGRISLDPRPGYQDTDTAGDWKELGLPAISGITAGPLQAEYCGCCDDEDNSCGSCPCDACPTTCHCAPGSYYKQQMDIVWTMANPVTNDESSVEIVYIIDRDCSGDISDGDLPYYTLETYTLASGASATETYTWIGWTSDDDLLHWDERKDGWWKDKEGNNVPYFYGFTWIQITASGSENFMIKDSDTGIAMFEPLPPGISFEDRCSILGDSCDECRLGLENYSGTDDFGSVEELALSPPQGGSSGGSADDNVGDDADVSDGAADGAESENQEEAIVAKNEDTADDAVVNGGEGDKDDEGEDEEITAREEDADMADDDEESDDDSDDEDEPTVARDEEDGEAADDDESDDGADNLDGEDNSNDGEEISNDNKDAGSDAIGGNTDTDDTDGGDSNDGGGGDLPMPIEDESGSAEIEISFTPQV